ncbi:MAG TPA: carbohydrate ABC transporter permease [Thermomicrobiales bacterium]|jgi:multiple sugar transport system permease protein|nr:carbohydrate ABC transporter permease [Thermomicrobiales bacterium]
MAFSQQSILSQSTVSKVREPETTNRNNGRRNAAIQAILLYGLLSALAALFMAPFAWLILSSLKPSSEVFSGNLLPTEPTLDNYRNVFTYAPVLRWLGNTLLVTVLSVILVVCSSVVVAYGFARLRFRGRGVLFAVLLASYMLPGAVTMIPTFLIWNELGLVGTFFPLFLGNIFGSSFYIFMLRQFFISLPQDLIDAGRLDGAGYFRILVGILLPLLRPAIVAIAVFEFQAKWDDFLIPLIYLNQRSDFTLSLGLASFKADFDMDWGLLMAASVLMTIPMIILFFAAQKLFIQGLSASTGIKG